MKETAPKPLFDNLDEAFDSSKDVSEVLACYAEDYKQAASFLYSYRGSAATFNAYRRDVERFLTWCWQVQKKSIQDVKRASIEAFIEFCQRPPTAWVGVKNVARFVNKDGRRVPNAEWRPFVTSVSKTAHQSGLRPDPSHYALSQKGVEAIFSILGSFYQYLVQEEYVDVNPVAQIRQKSKFIRRRQGKPIIRRLSDLQWGYVIETAEFMAEREPAAHERTLFIMNALYAMYLRISELTASDRWVPQMGHFHRDQDGNWWFTTVGKGNKERRVSVCDAMLEALRRYRRHLGLSPLPAPGETTPLVPSTRGKGPITSTRHIRLIVQGCFDTAIARMRKDGFDQEAELLSAATVHWLRHTGISDDVKHRPREHVRDDAGHGSSAITDRYIDIETRARHASAKKKRIKPE